MDLTIENKWLIVTACTSGLYRRAIARISDAISAQAGYVIPVIEEGAADEALLAANHVVVLGEASSALLGRFVGEGLISAPGHAQGYAIRVCDSAWNGERQMALILGGSAVGVLYGAVEFVNRYAGDDGYPHATQEVTCHRFWDEPFRRRMPEFTSSGAPSFARRGIWTWGHCIYDYRRYLDNMVTLKLNQLCIWNDYAPINAAEVVEYAHARGIEIIWGFSWGWSTNCLAPGFTIDDDRVIEEWAEKIYRRYTEEYAASGADGIYFQSFTETREDAIGGVSIAAAVVKWVNRIGRRLLAAYPTLRIQFGLHATSVAQKLADIAGVDPRIRIVWEDCGAFPYDYNPRHIGQFDETLGFNRAITTLRGEDEKFGAVLKGLVKLDWSRFEHQKGPFLLGERDPAWIAERRREKEKIWRFIQGDWIENLPYAGKLLAETARLTGGNAEMLWLVEDGCFEDGVFYPVALGAALLWDAEADLPRLMGQVARIPAVRFANL